MIRFASSHFEFYETDAEANPTDEKRKIPYSDAKAVLALRYPGPLHNILHFIDLACSAPGHPVDVTFWKDGQLNYSARLTYFAG